MIRNTLVSVACCGAKERKGRSRYKKGRKIIMSCIGHTRTKTSIRHILRTSNIVIQMLTIVDVPAAVAQNCL